MPWTSIESYKDAKGALIDLALFLKEQFMSQFELQPKQCCTNSKQKDSEAEYCSKCRRSLLKEEFDGEAFIEWLQSMSGVDIDTFHGDFIDWDQSHRWQSNGLEGTPNQRFVYEAEWVLAAAVGHSHGGNPVTFEQICKNRTRNKEDKFSYY